MSYPEIKVDADLFDELERIEFELRNLRGLNSLAQNSFIDKTIEEKVEEGRAVIQKIYSVYGKGKITREEKIFELQYQDTINRLYRNFNDEEFKCREITF